MLYDPSSTNIQDICSAMKQVRWIIRVLFLSTVSASDKGQQPLGSFASN